VSQIQTTKSCLLGHDVVGGKAANEYGTVVVKPEGKRPHGFTDMGKRQSCAFVEHHVKEEYGKLEVWLHAFFIS